VAADLAARHPGALRTLMSDDRTLDLAVIPNRPFATSLRRSPTHLYKTTVLSLHSPNFYMIFTYQD
jgi:hypothetical protein